MAIYVAGGVEQISLCQTHLGLYNLVQHGNDFFCLQNSYSFLLYVSAAYVIDAYVVSHLLLLSLSALYIALFYIVTFLHDSWFISSTRYG